MPTYEYKCFACGHTFERFQSIMAAPVRRCPECGKAKVKRLLGTGAGVIFKGSGFYTTDYRDKSYAEKAKADSAAGSSSSSSESKTESKSDTKSDSKSESKSDAKPAESKPAATTESKPAAQSQPKPEPKSASKSASKSAKKR